MVDEAVCDLWSECNRAVRRDGTHGAIVDANQSSERRRHDAGRKAFKKVGIEMKDVYLTMGRYDLVCVIEAPDDETYAKAVLALGSQGNVSTETLKAFNEDQFREIIGSL